MAKAAKGEGGGGCYYCCAVIDFIMIVVLQSKNISQPHPTVLRLTMPGVRSEYRFCEVLWINIDSYE